MAAPRRLKRLTQPVVAAMSELPEGPVVVALSGGADSAAAAWAAVESGRPTRAVHVHHGLVHSDMLAAAAGAIGADLGIPVDVRRVTVPVGSSMEARARAVRMEALEATLEAEEWVVTGHTLDDQVETLLMRMVRGTGLDGLVGIEAVRGRYLRPLLGVSRSDTREIATIVGLPWRDDPENLDQRHLRNRVRNDLLPAIANTFGMNPYSSLARLGALVAEDVAVLDALAAEVPRHDAPGRVRLAVGGLEAVGPAVAARVIRSGFVTLDPPYPPGSAVIAEIMAMLHGGGRSTVAGNVTIERQGPWLVLSSVASPDPHPPKVVPVPGSTTWGGFRIDVTVSEHAPQIVPMSPWTMVRPVHGFDALTVRAAEASDVISIGRGRKRVFDALAEAAVPTSARASYPVVTVDDSVVWIPGIRRSGWSGDRADRYLCVVATEEAQWQRYER